MPNSYFHNMMNGSLQVWHSPWTASAHHPLESSHCLRETMPLQIFRAECDYKHAFSWVDNLLWPQCSSPSFGSLFAPKNGGSSQNFKSAILEVRRRGTCFWLHKQMRDSINVQNMPNDYTVFAVPGSNRVQYWTRGTSKFSASFDYGAFPFDRQRLQFQIVNEVGISIIMTDFIMKPWVLLSLRSHQLQVRTKPESQMKLLRAGISPKKSESSQRSWA